jgi:hypothetical protein
MVVHVTGVDATGAEVSIESETRARQSVNRADNSIDNNGMAVTHE